MFLFSSFKKRRNQVAILDAVSKKLNIPSETIVSLLREAGFEIYNLPFTLLNSDHLEILSNAYINSLKSYYSSVSKNYYNLSQDEQNNLRRFFVDFIRPANFLSFENYEDSLKKVFKVGLDNSRIKDFFFELILEIDYRVYAEQNIPIVGRSDNKDFFNKVRHKLKIKVKFKRTLSDLRLLLHSILICCHYHIFSDDENHNREAVTRFSFSGFLKHQQGEALKNTNYLKLKKKWMTLNPL